MSSQLELFWLSGSPFAWRVQLALSLHGVDYVSHRLDAAKGELKQPDYLALNPRGQVPVLRDGDVVLRESMAILVYLNAKFPDWQLFGQTPVEQGNIWQQICEFDNQMVPLMRQFVRPIFFGGLENKREDVIAAAESVEKEFKGLDESLAQSAWFVGEKPSAADIAIYPGLKLVERAATREQAKDLNLTLLPFAEKNPHLHDWILRFEEIEGVSQTYPPHWQ